MKTQKRILFYGLIIFLLLAGLGCDSTPAERVAAVKNFLNQAREVNQHFDDSIANLEKIISDSKALLNDPNIPAEVKPEIQAALNIASEKLAKLQVEKQKVVASITRWQEALNQADPNNLEWIDEMQLYSTGAREASKFLPQPYRGYAYLATALIPLIASLLKNIKQSQQINKDKKQLTEIVISVDELLKSKSVDSPENAKEILKKKQSRETRRTVDDIRDPLVNTAPEH